MEPGDSFYRRASFVWCRLSRLMGSTATAAGGSPLAEGKIVRSQNPPSKTDRSGQKWGGKFMYYRKDSTNVVNFGA
eukprot:2535082-Prymnesium_polylepis.1